VIVKLEAARCTGPVVEGLKDVLRTHPGTTDVHLHLVGGVRTTVLRLDDGRRLIVPNELLVQTPVFNHTVIDPRVQVVIDVWLAPGGDATRAVELLSAADDVDARVAEVTHEGIRIAVTEWASTARERGPLASRLRKESLQCLRDASLSSDLAG